MKMIKIKTAAETRKEVLGLLDRKTIEILTGRNYNYRTRDGPDEEIEQFRSQLQCRISSSIYARLEWLLKKGFRIEDLEAMLKVAENEKDSTVKWANNKAKILWPKWKKIKRKKIKRETENERWRERRKNLSAA